MSMFACVDVPDLPIQAVVRRQPGLRQQAVALLHGKAPLVEVYAANEAARALGVAAGMAKLQAEACAGAILRMRSPAEEESAHAALLDAALSVSPRVEDMGTASGTALLELAGLERLLGTTREIAHLLRRKLAESGMEANVAAAASPDAALLLARGHRGVCVAERGEERKMLAPLPVEVLPASAEALLSLHRWGVRTLGRLAELPRVGVVERLGQAGGKLHQLACGEVKRGITAYEAPITFVERMPLEHEIGLLEPLFFLLNGMLERICQRLTMRALAAQELELSLALAGPQPYRQRMKLAVPSQNGRALLKLWQLRLQSAPPPAPVTGLELTAIAARPRAVQAGLFVPNAPEPEKLEIMLRRLGCIAGAGNVGSPALKDSHQPDAFEMREFGVAEASCIPRACEGEAKQWFALRRFRPAPVARVTLQQGKPAYLYSQPCTGQVLEAAGPWRHSGAWWRREAWEYEEWDVAVQQRDNFSMQSFYRMQKNLATGLWSVFGAYD